MHTYTLGAKEIIYILSVLFYHLIFFFFFNSLLVQCSVLHIEAASWDGGRSHDLSLMYRVAAGASPLVIQVLAYLFPDHLQLYCFLFFLNSNPFIHFNTIHLSVCNTLGTVRSAGNDEKLDRQTDVAHLSASYRATFAFGEDSRRRGSQRC